MTATAPIDIRALMATTTFIDMRALMATTASIDIRTHGYYCPYRYTYSWLLLPL